MVEAKLGDSSHGYTALTTAAGFVPLDAWSTVRVTGADRATFLHNMCTADVRSLAAGQGVEAFFTDVKGKIVAHAIILAGAEQHLIIGVPEQAERLIAHLDRYIIREDVQLADNSGELSWTLIAGPKSATAIGKLTRQPAIVAAAPWGHGAGQIGGVDVCVVRCNLPWSGGSLVGSPTVNLESLQKELLAADIGAAEEADWCTLRIESGWPLLGVDFDGTNLPQEVGRDTAAINLRKGCYLGQETVARIDALGHVNKRLATVRLEGEQLAGVGAELLADGQPVGHIMSACWSPRVAASLALAMVRRGHNDVGARIDCDGKSGEVISTPAVAPQVLGGAGS